MGRPMLRIEHPPAGGAGAADARGFDLLNRWQRDLPLVAQPFDAMGAALGTSGSAVRECLARFIADGTVSRVGGVFGAGVGAGLLCAMRVEPDRLEAVAALVDAHPAVNHDYQRAHEWNLWFVVTGADALDVHRSVDELGAALERPILRLPMLESYRIDLGFDLGHALGRECADDVADTAFGATPPERLRVETALRPLAAAVERGLPLVERPFAAIGEPLGMDDAAVRRQLGEWRASGVLRRFGVVVRHHELGISANAMLVVDIGDREPREVGLRLASQPGVTLCYRRARARQWPYDVYCMFHGWERGAVQARIDAALAASGLAHAPHAALFTVRRFKQTGSRYFADAAGALAS